MKNNRLRNNKPIKALVAFAFFLLQSNFIYAVSPAYILPEGGSPTKGVSIVYNGRILNINAPNNAIINWISYNIGQGNTVNYYQPGSSSVVLNRVIGIDPSSIYGSLNANGRVFIVNPNGIFFGQGSQINVNGLLASTLGISDSDFLAGNYNFTQSGNTASIINQGNIRVANGGYVLLLSNAINNSGVIVAKLGQVIFAAGSKMTVALDDNSDISVTINDAVKNNVFGPDGTRITQAIQNNGSITADGGSIVLNAQVLNGIFDNAVNNTGLIQANNLVNNNGSVELQAVGGNISATGSSQISGGNVFVSSDSDIDAANIHGGEVDIFAGNNMTLQDIHGGDLNLSAGNNLNATGIYGGSIAMVAGNDLDAVNVHGNDIALASGNYLTADNIQGQNIELFSGNDITAEDISGNNVGMTAANNINADGIHGTNTSIYAGENINADSIYGNNIDLEAGNDLVVGIVNAGTGSVQLSAGDSISGLDQYSLITGDTLNLTAGNNIGTALNYIVTNSNALNITAGGNAYLNTGNVEITNMNVGGAAELLTGNVTLDNVTTGGDLTLEAYSGNITLNGTIQSTGGSVDLLSDNGSINAKTGSNVIAVTDSIFSTPHGTIGLNGPVNVHITHNLVLDIGNKVGGKFGNSGFLIGEVNGPTGDPLVLPSSLASPLYPPGNIFFNGKRIWPSESELLLSQASSGLLSHFVFPTAELLKFSQVNTFDPVTSSDQSGGLFLYHPLMDVDSGAFDQEFQLDEGAYDFIDGQIDRKHK